LSAYLFPPTPDAVCPPTFAWWDNAFTDKEIEQIKSYGNTLPVYAAETDAVESVNDKIRKNTISWISNTQDTDWFYARIANVARQLNTKFFNFDLHGFLEDMQFTRYEEINAHYTWHIDASKATVISRKLSLVLQLSDPSEYEGGELQLFSGIKPETVTKQKGAIVLFPSYVLHRVTPLTKGTRYSLVVWISGSPFK